VGLGVIVGAGVWDLLGDVTDFLSFIGTGFREYLCGYMMGE
jgi:hypothetical protein